MAKRCDFISRGVLILLLLSMGVWANNDDPEPRCGTKEQMITIYERNPESRREALELSHKTKTFDRKNRAAEAYIIPTVFHVFGTDFAGSKVDDALIIDALEKTNRDFQGLNGDWLEVSEDFDAVKEAINITFKLAKKDPNGKATTGIIYHPEESGFGNGSGFDKKIQQYAWDNYKYMNVYIMLDLYADADYYNSGVSWYPDSWMSDNNLARTVYNGRYLGTNTDENFRRILTHEFGHFFNLKHTFDEGCSDPNDECDDTPATTSNSGSCNTTEEKCPGYGIPNGENFMDYTKCYRMFTKDQVSRMITALETHPARKPLWQKENLILTGLSDEGLTGIVANFTASATSGGTGAAIQFTNGTQTEDGTTVSKLVWSFPGGTPSGFTGETPPNIVYEKEGTYDVTLTATNSKGASHSETKEGFITIKNEYSDPIINYGTYSHIGNVTFGSINNTTGENGVVDYTDQHTTEVDKGKMETLSITANVGNSGQSDWIRVRAWFDWNKNWKFDADESVMNEEFQCSDGNSTFTTNVTIPESAVVDKTALRVIVCYKMGTSGDNADDILDSGECEDYGIQINGTVGTVTEPQSAVGDNLSAIYTNKTIQFNTPLPEGSIVTIFDSKGRELYRKNISSKLSVIPLNLSTKLLYWRVQTHTTSHTLQTGKVLFK